MSTKTTLQKRKIPVFLTGFIMFFLLLFVTGRDIANAATTYYVSLTGKDTNGGTTQATPWRRISYAAQQAQAGDTVIVLAGNYGNETVKILNSGTETAPIIFRADGEVLLEDNYSSNKAFSMQGKSYITIEGFTIKKYNKGIWFENSDHIRVLNNTVSESWGGGGNGITARWSRDSFIENNTVYNSGKYNYHIYHATRITVKNNVAYNDWSLAKKNPDTTSDYGFKYGYVSDSYSENNIAYNSGWHGWRLRHDVINNTFKGDKAYNNGGYGFELNDNIDNNTFIDGMDDGNNPNYPSHRGLVGGGRGVAIYDKSDNNTFINFTIKNEDKGFDVRAAWYDEDESGYNVLTDDDTGKVILDKNGDTQYYNYESRNNRFIHSTVENVNYGFRMWSPGNIMEANTITGAKRYDYYIEIGPNSEIINPLNGSFTVRINEVPVSPTVLGDPVNSATVRFTDGRTFKLDGDAGGHTNVALTEAGTYTIEVEEGQPFLCTGRVFEEGRGRGIEGVLVSDGVSVVRTSATGSYSLRTSDPNPVVFVSVPDGYMLDLDRFWRRVSFKQGRTSESADFALRSRKKVSKFTFLQISDSHYVVGTHATQDVATFIRDADTMNPAPEFVIATGDLSMGVDNLEKSEELKEALSQYQGFVDVFKPLTFPLLKVIGNHDDAVSLPKGVAERGKEIYRRFFGPLNYSFDYGKVHFVALDADIDDGPLFKLIARAGKAPGKWLDGTYDVFDERALSWLEKDLSFQPQGKPVVLFAHQPPYEQKNFDKLVGMLKDRNFKGAFSGHWHRSNTLQERTRNGIGPFVVTGALYGNWGGKPNPDGTWRGYRVISVDGDKVKSVYAAIDRPFQGALLNVNVRRRKKNPLGGKAEILTDILDMKHRLKGVSVRLDGGKEVPMTGTPETELWARWRGVINTTEVADGPHKLIITPFTDGERWNYEFEVMVKNRGVETGMEEREDAEERPGGVALFQNVPNPFNQWTEIRYVLPEARGVELGVWNLLGQKVAALVEGAQEAGDHVVRWDGQDGSGRGVSSGMYFYRMKAGAFVSTKRMVILK